MTPSPGAVAPAALEESLAAWLATVFGRPVAVEQLARLPGGASQESWGFSCLGRALVLRRELGGRIYDYGVDREGEYRVLEVAHRAGVRVPQPVAYTSDLLGRPAFVMERLPGEAIGRRLVSDPRYAAVRPALIAQLAEDLAAVHRLDAAATGFLPAPKTPDAPALDELDRLLAQLDDLGEPHPALELGLRWLRRHLPPAGPPGVVHGDFRTGNFLVTADAGLTGVLDWEYVHQGDPAEDLGWFCVRAWRFGADERVAGGLADRATFLAAYAGAGGRGVTADTVAWWELFGNVRWAVGALAQAHRHLSGAESSVELASLGRICAEMELETLRLMDELDG